jgi:methionyl-tRNA formyltransferase
MKLVVLAGQGMSTNILLNALFVAGHREVTVIIERPVSQKQLARNRMKRLGAATVAGQILFVACVVRALRGRSEARIDAILGAHGLSREPCDAYTVHHVPSVNDPATTTLLQEATPDLVLVNGTRIIRAPVIDATPAPFLNMHVGITPKYRGVHGGYWALHEGEPELFGATVHYVDTGVDTGQIVHQATAAPTEKDNFVTYPALQQAAALPGLMEAITAIGQGEMPPGRTREDLPSRQWYHPTLTQYLRGWMRGVR